MDISQVLSARYPGCLWGLEGNSYEGLEWRDNNVKKPTEQELLDAWEKVKYDTEYAMVESARNLQYIKRSDPLFFKWQLGDVDKQDWINEREKIKLENPYPNPIDV